MLEEHETSTNYTNLVRAQYVWSPVYIDALVERDRDPARTGSGSQGERLYVQQDANWNVTALVTAAGAVAERYVYDPFGNAAVYDAGWNNVLAASQYGWVYLHQGGRFDAAGGLYGSRHRDYAPTLGRWMRADPLGYAAGSNNLYDYLDNGPLAHIDPEGLEVTEGPVYVRGVESYKQPLKNEKLGIDGVLQVWTNASAWNESKNPNRKFNWSDGIYISFKGKGADKISHAQFHSGVLKVSHINNGKKSVPTVEKGAVLTAKKPFISADGPDDLRHEYLDNNWSRDKVGYVEVGGVGQTSPEETWMHDGPGTAARIRDLWHSGPEARAKPYAQRDDVFGIYLTEYFTTYVVACGQALRRVRWTTYASWTKDQGRLILEGPQQISSLTGVDGPYQFKDSKSFQYHQSLVKGVGGSLGAG